MSATDATTLQLEIEIDVPREHAFRVFTERFDEIKPRAYNMLEVDIAETVFEPQVGGHLYDRGVDGSICRWARVLEFSPPERFLITWDISARWQIETDLSRASEVEVRFVELAPQRTRVELEHRHLDRHGEGWQGFRAALGSENGWPVFLESFRALTVPA